MLSPLGVKGPIYNNRLAETATKSVKTGNIQASLVPASFDSSFCLFFSFSFLTFPYHYYHQACLASVLDGSVGKPFYRLALSDLVVFLFFASKHKREIPRWRRRAFVFLNCIFVWVSCKVPLSPVYQHLWILHQVFESWECSKKSKRGTGGVDSFISFFFISASETSFRRGTTRPGASFSNSLPQTDSHVFFCRSEEDMGGLRQSRVLACMYVFSVLALVPLSQRRT